MGAILMLILSEVLLGVWICAFPVQVRTEHISEVLLVGVATPIIVKYTCRHEYCLQYLMAHVLSLHKTVLKYITSTI
jgi:hypothetical protein